MSTPYTRDKILANKPPQFYNIGGPVNQSIRLFACPGDSHN